MKSITRRVRVVAGSAKTRTKKLLIKLLDTAIAGSERMLKMMKRKRMNLLYTGHVQGAE